MLPRLARWLAALWLGGLLAACGGGGSGAAAALVVNSLLDRAEPPAGVVTLRSALATAAPGQPIVFDPALDGGTIALDLVAEEHTMLHGEVMGIRNEASGPVSYLVGWFARDYGRSALVARKNVVIDASALPAGITLAWAGGDSPGARVLAVDGDLTLVRVNVRGGRSVASARVPAGDPAQPWTLARGGALAVWGTARLKDCVLHDNRVEGDFEPSRDRGAFGGAVYADLVEIDGCTISGNEALGGGAAGGGVYSVGGAGHGRGVSRIVRTAISGNRIRGLFAYGGGVYSDGGGIGVSKTMHIASSTVAGNLVAPPPGLPAPLLSAQGYWRGGGIYMSNGRLELLGVTVTGNRTEGHARTDSRGRRNLAGGVAATVGDAHAAEQMIVAHSIIAGNAVQEVGGARYPHDLFTGSLVHFSSGGHNRIAALDFSQMLVPVGSWDWQSLVRRHWPQPGDAIVDAAADVLDLEGGTTISAKARSVGVDAGQPALLSIQPRGSALARIPPGSVDVNETWGQYRVASGGRDDFAAVVLQRIESRLALPGLAAGLRGDFEAWLRAADPPYADPDGSPILTLEATRFFGPAQTWPREAANQPWIEFWHRLDGALAARTVAGIGPEGLNDAIWQHLFTSGALDENPAITVSLETRTRLRVTRQASDQRGTPRPADQAADIGAIELP